MLHQFTMRTIKSRFDSSGRSIKYYMPAIVQGEGAVRNVSSFKKSTIESLIPGKKYKILNATSHPTFGIELKADSVIGETGVVSTGSQRREVQLSMDGRSALLTLWGKETDLEVVAGDMYIVRNIVPKLQETFEGVVESVSFASNLIEINDMMLTISKDNLAKIFPGRQFSAVQVTGLKRNGEICEIDVKKAKM
uniref:Uncharacterized protein n=1 Tax=Magallana gigas TaxID=29159 RepID=K1Q0Y0_MAGGI